ncbi:hypothetical protein [Fusobacterium necrophorum]|nr:hypothetical protein [Fusobacterium necrophorum]MDK4477061.1 hypothetical protein [Fusobacterium necrophorum]
MKTEILLRVPIKLKDDLKRISLEKGIPLSSFITGILWEWLENRGE